MANITFEKINPENSANQTVMALLRVHWAIIARIENGEKFYKNLRDVTGELHAATTAEIAQCHKVLLALEHMNAGELKQAYNLLGQIKEYLPNAH